MLSISIVSISSPPIVEITDRTSHQRVIKIGGMSGNSGNSDNSDNKRPRVEDSWAMVLEQFTKLEVKALAGKPSKDELNQLKAWTSSLHACIEHRIDADDKAELHVKVQERNCILDSKVCVTCKKVAQKLHPCQCIMTGPDSAGLALCEECAKDCFLEKQRVVCSTYLCSECDTPSKCAGCGNQSCHPCAEEEAWGQCDGCGPEAPVFCGDCLDLNDPFARCGFCEASSCNDCGMFSECEGDCGEIFCEDCAQKQNSVRRNDNDKKLCAVCVLLVFADCRDY